MNSKKKIREFVLLEKSTPRKKSENFTTIGCIVVFISVEKHITLAGINLGRAIAP